MNEENINSYYSGVINGKYSVEVDEGEYFVVYQDKYGYYEFYENAFDWETATTIPVNCEDKIKLNMNLSEEMSTELFTVSGNVSYDDGTTASYEQVFFEGTGPMGGREKMIMMSTMTDESGNYSMELPNGYTYFAYIEGEWDPVTGIQRVLYYNQTYNRKDAEKMILESDLSGINFIIEKGGNYTFYSVTGNVSMADGQPVMGAMVSFEGFYDVDYGRGNYFFNSVSTDSSGNYSIELPDIIEYRAYVTSPYVKLYRPLYYNQTYNPEEAEVLKLTGDLSGINFVIEEPDFKMFKVSGKVTNSDGEGISGAMVNFDGFNDAPDYYYNRWSESVSTNEDGYYEVVLPEIFKYIASAYQPFNGDRWKCIQPMFFDQTYNPDQATIIELTSDRNDINFKFGADENGFKNSISGTVVNSQDELIQNVFVMAYLIGSQNDEFYFDGRASMANSNGEFKFVSLNPGKYVFFAVPKELSYLPGFYIENDFATMNWDQATIVELSDESEITGIKIKLSAMDTKELDGGIIQANGRVQTVKNQNSQERNAVSGAIVYLESNEGKVQQYSTSNNDGSFNLKNLPSGNFKLKVEKIGYKAYSKNITFSGNSYYDLGEILLMPEVLSKDDDKSYSMINIKVSPNPVVDNATISFEGIAGKAVIKLINAKGQQLISNEIITINGSNNHTLSLSELANGAYFVIVDNGGKSFAYPIVIKR
jgi:protocatechuate 3,4-dioxygenase beta subunit